MFPREMLRDRQATENWDYLVEMRQEEWNSFPWQIIENLVSSKPRRW